MVRTENFPAIDLTGLDIRLDHGSLELLMTDEEDFRILVAGDDSSCDLLQAEIHDRCLKLRQPSGGLRFKPNEPNWLDVTVHVPVSWKGSADLKVTSGALTVQGFSGSDIRLASSSGPIHVMDLVGITLTLKTRSGHCTVSCVDCDRFRMRSFSGTLDLEGGSSDQWDLMSCNGDLQLAMARPFDALRIRSLEANVNLSLPFEKADANIRSLSGKIRTADLNLSGEAPKVSMLSLTGNLMLEKLQH